MQRIIGKHRDLNRTRCLALSLLNFVVILIGTVVPLHAEQIQITNGTRFDVLSHPCDQLIPLFGGTYSVVNQTLGQEMVELGDRGPARSDGSTSRPPSPEAPPQERFPQPPIDDLAVAFSSRMNSPDSDSNSSRTASTTNGVLTGELNMRPPRVMGRFHIAEILHPSFELPHELFRPPRLHTIPV